MNGLFCILVLAALAALTLGFLFVSRKKHRDRGSVDPNRHRYAGELGDSVYPNVYGGGFIGDYGGFGGHGGGFTGHCGGFTGDGGGFGGGDCGGGF